MLTNTTSFKGWSVANRSATKKLPFDRPVRRALLHYCCYQSKKKTTNILNYDYVIVDNFLSKEPRKFYKIVINYVLLIFLDFFLRTVVLYSISCEYILHYLLCYSLLCSGLATYSRRHRLIKWTKNLIGWRKFTLRCRLGQSNGSYRNMKHCKVTWTVQNCTDCSSSIISSEYGSTHRNHNKVWLGTLQPLVASVACTIKYAPFSKAVPSRLSLADNYNPLRI
jgi:hypothetical protein